MAKFSRELKFARDIALGAGNILRQGSTKRHRVKLKGRVDLVTEMDLKSEKYITDRIRRSFPEHSILAEESGSTGCRKSHLWIIDPLDGTTNFAHGYPAYCVSIALMIDGQVVIGSVYDPVHNEMFHTSRGTGAYLNRRHIHVSGETELSHSLLATGFPYDIAETRIDNLDNFARMYKAARGIRRAGSAALDLCYLACGRFDGFWELKLHPWDTAAGMLLVCEAGGRVTRINGGKYSIFDKNILASNGKIHRPMQQILLGHKKQ